jgi:hypothetical protein
MASYRSSEPGGLPGIGELTVEPPTSGRSPDELSAIMRHSMGEIDIPPELQRHQDGLDVSELREALGL